MSILNFYFFSCRDFYKLTDCFHVGCIEIYCMTLRINLHHHIAESVYAVAVYFRMTRNVSIGFPAKLYLTVVLTYCTM